MILYRYTIILEYSIRYIYIQIILHYISHIPLLETHSKPNQDIISLGLLFFAPSVASQNSPAKPDPFLLGGVYVGTSPGAGQREGADGGRDIVSFSFSGESSCCCFFLPGLAGDKRKQIF